MATIKRFGDLDEESIRELEENKDSRSTKNTIKRSVKIFRAFLKENDMNDNFEDFPRENLNDALKKFYANARTEKGEHYKTNSMSALKYGLSRHLLDHNIDINDAEFSGSNQTFKAVCADLARKGKGGTQHKPAIAKEDMAKLYQECKVNHAFDIDTPVGLQQKVFFEILFYLCRRGFENLREMTKETFVLEKDASGLEYVAQKNLEADKNHTLENPDETQGEGE